MHFAELGWLFWPENRLWREGTIPVNHKLEQCGPSQTARKLQQPPLARSELQGPINHSQSQSERIAGAAGCRGVSTAQ